MKKYKIIIYYLIIFLGFFIYYKSINLIKVNDINKIDNNILLKENENLKQEIKELSKIDYHNYDYTLGKIVFNNIYQSSISIVGVQDIKDNSPVINEEGLIGIYYKHYLIPTKELNIGVNLNNNDGVIEKGILKIKKDNYQIGDKIYSSSYSKVPPNILIGYVKEIKENAIDDEIKVTYINNKNTYVGILNA